MRMRLNPGDILVAAIPNRHLMAENATSLIRGRHLRQSPPGTIRAMGLKHLSAWRGRRYRRGERRGDSRRTRGVS